MTDEDRWQRWFNQRHAMPELARWACGLRFFRFCRAVGGHANDGDLFLAALRYDGEAELLSVFEALGIASSRLSLDTPQPVIGQSYPGDVFAAFPFRVAAHPTVAQPGHVLLAGAAAYVWAGNDRVEIQVSDEEDLWDVSEAAFEAAQRIEARIEPLACRIIDPPRSSLHCLCPAFYPDIFASCG